MNRHKEVKTTKKPGKKSRFRPLVKAKRREAFYKTGKGSVGLLVRRSRVVRVIRNVRRIENVRYQELTGIETKGKKQVLYKGFPDVIVGAADAYANRVMELAAEFAKKRRKNGAKGMKLRIEDIRSAKWAIKTIAHQ